MFDLSQIPVKVRLAPLPKRNSNFKHNISIEERLNHSVKMNEFSVGQRSFSGFENRSEFGCPRSNYDYRGVDLKKMLHHNAMIALRAKDKKRRNSSDQDSENLSIILNGPKRKRSFDEDDNSEENFSFTQVNRNKIARTENYRVPLKNKIISSHFKNNEIKSSYFSIDKNYEDNCLKRKSSDQNSSRKIIKIPTLSVTNASSNENSRSSSVENLSNASISPISKLNDKTISSNNSSIKNNVVIDTTTVSSQENNKDVSLNSNNSGNMDQDDSFQYKIPEHFHSIDEHIRDENKAKSRLGAFLKAIYNVTSSFTTKEKPALEEKKPDIVANITNPINLIPPVTSSIPTSSFISTVSSFILPKTASPTISTTSNSSFKLPSVSINTTKTVPSNPISFNSSSINFNLNATSSTDNKNSNTNDNNSSQTSQNGFFKPLISSIFSFGGSTKSEEKKTDQNLSVSNSNSLLKNDFSLPITSNGNSVFKFGSSSSTQENQPTPSNSINFSFKSNSTLNANAITNVNNIPTANINSNLNPISGLNSISTNDSIFNKTSFNFAPIPVNNKPATNFSFNPSNVQKPTTSGFDFSLSQNNSVQNPSFNFGAKTTTTKSDNQGFDFSSNQNLNSSFKLPSFEFGNDKSSKPNVPSFSFGGDKNSNSLTSKPLLKTEVINTGFNFNTNSNQLSNNPSFNFNSSNNFKSNTSTPFKFDASSANEKPSFNFGSTNTNSNTFNFSGSNPQPQFNATSSNNTGFSFKYPFTIGGSSTKM